MCGGGGSSARGCGGARLGWAGGARPIRSRAVLTLADCWRSFVRRETPPLLAAAIVAAAALRVALGAWGGRYYRSIWRGHRLHHHKNERYLFGVTSTVGDHILGTAPDQAQVAKSHTARKLRADVQS
jgi:hypothetical protein